MKEITWFETTQCMVRVYEYHEEICGERLFMVSSYHKKNGKNNIRFATRQQLYSLLTQYRYSVIRYKLEYEQFMDKLSFFKLD